MINPNQPRGKTSTDLAAGMRHMGERISRRIEELDKGFSISGRCAMILDVPLFQLIIV